jgi:hypothetical protein
VKARQFQKDFTALSAAISQIGGIAMPGGEITQAAARASCIYSMERPSYSDQMEMRAVHAASLAPRLRQKFFLTVLLSAAFLEGWFLGPLGFDVLAGAIVITIMLAIGWMRSYWDAA